MFFLLLTLNKYVIITTNTYFVYYFYIVISYKTKWGVGMNKNIINDKNLINDYYNQIKDIPLLNEKEEKQLFFEYKNGDLKAKQKLVEHNLKLVVYIARRYYHDELSLDDLIQEGNCALINCVDLYDYDRENKFSSYAIKAITNRIIRYIQNNMKTIRVPVHLHKYIMEYDEIILNNPNISDEEIISIMDINKELLEKIKYAKMKVISIDEPIHDDTDIIVESIIKYDELYTEDLAINNILLESILSLANECLTQNEKEVITYRYCYGGFSQREIGNMLGLSKQRVEQIEKSALKKIRNSLKQKYTKIYFDKDEMKFKSKMIINNLF